MPSYFFILGRNPALSIAEIESVLNKEKISFKQLELNLQVLLINSEEQINIRDVVNKLGGTIKAGEVLSNSLNLNAEKLASFLPQKENKVFFGFSLYTDKKKRDYDIKKTAIELKKHLKEKGVKSRWVTSKEPSLSSVIVQKNKLISQGVEFVIISGDKDYLGRTLAVQKFEEYSERDYGRPHRSMLRGILPPKLAKIMINLSGIKEDETLLDPFCGQGTILQEALLLGYRKIIGSDSHKEAVKESRDNLEWLVKKYPELEKGAFQIMKINALKLSSKITVPLKAIVTEPYLGPPRIREHEIRETRNELEKLYIGVFKEFYKVLETDGEVIIIFPVFSLKGKLWFMEILDEIKKMGFNQEFPFEFPTSFNKFLTKRNSFLYSRPEQKVLREILIFTKEKQ